MSQTHAKGTKFFHFYFFASEQFMLMIRRGLKRMNYDKSRFMREALIEKAYRHGLIKIPPASLALIKGGGIVSFTEIRNFRYKANPISVPQVNSAPVGKLPRKTIEVIDYAAAGKLVRAWRIKLGMSVPELAAESGISKHILFKMELGQRTWTEKRFKDICAILTAQELSRFGRPSVIG